MGNFHYVCSTCTSLDAKTIFRIPTNDANPTSVDNLSSESMHKLQKEVSSLQSAFVSVSGSLIQILRQLTELKCSFQSFTDPVLSVSPPSQDCKNASLPSSPATVPAQPASYVSVITNAIAVSVKKAVADSIKDREIMSRDKSSVMIHGLPESKQDSQDIAKVLKAISVTCEPIAWFRLGKLIKDDFSGRPLRLILSKPSDKPERQHRFRKGVYFDIFI